MPLLDLPGRGIRLSVTDHAPDRPELRPLLLAHATGFCGGVWAPIVAALCGEYRVITFDQRGHGDSDKPPGAYEWASFAGDVAALLDALDLSDVVAVGHSKGGAAVAGAAAEHPGRIARAVLLDPVLVQRVEPGAARPSSNLLAVGARRRRLVWSSREEMLRSFSRRPPFSRWRRDALEAYVEHGTARRADGSIELKCPGEIEAQVYEGGMRSASLDHLAKLRVPTLIVAGEESATLPSELARAAARLLCDGELVVLPGVGHFVPMEAPEEVIRLIRRWGSA